MPNNINQQALYISSGSPETENRPPDGYSGGQLGSRITIKDKADASKAKGYQMVEADSIMDVEPTEGAVAYWLNPTGYVVTTDVSAAGRGNPAGVFRMAVTLGNVCFVQQKGPGTTQLQGGPTAAPTTAGLIVIPSATDAKADVLAAGTAASYPPLGTSAGAALGTTPETFLCDLDLPGRE